MMKRFFAVSVMFLYLVSARTRLERCTAAFWGSFDTVTVITAYSPTKQQFDTAFKAAALSFAGLSRSYDRFSYSDEVVNIAYLNRWAAERPVKVDESVFSLLRFGGEGYKRSGGLVDPMLGALTMMWHDEIKRNDGAAPPDRRQLLTAAEHCGIEKLILDEETHTVRITDPTAQIDAGAFAKGFAVERISRIFSQAGLNRAAISGGGNVKVLDPPDGRQSWSIGIQSPDAAALEHGGALGSLALNNLSVATSGDYQRGFDRDGRRYHHLIDPKSLYPAQRFRSVTVVCQSAGDADLFSTALFLAGIEEGERIAEREGLAVLWVLSDGSVTVNEAMRMLLQC